MTNIIALSIESLSSPVARDLPSIFDDSDNVYNTYALPSEDPRKVRYYAQTGAGTPRALRASSSRASKVR